MSKSVFRFANTLALGDKSEEIFNLLNEFGYEVLGKTLIDKKIEGAFMLTSRTIKDFKANLSELIGYIFGHIVCEDSFNGVSDMETAVKVVAYLGNRFSTMLGSYFEDKMMTSYYTERQRICSARKKEREKNATY